MAVKAGQNCPFRVYTIRTGTLTTAKTATNYTVTFKGDGTNYTGSAKATVNIKVNLGIGMSYQGGKVFYLDGKGGGLIAATSDHSKFVQWGGYGTSITGADGTAIGTGKQNTADIVKQLGSGNYAAKVADDYSVTDGGVTYSDWFLPSRDELNEMYKNRGKIGGFSVVSYWSSSEASSTNAWTAYPNFGTHSNNVKSSIFSIRFVRSF